MRKNITLLNLADIYLCIHVHSMCFQYFQLRISFFQCKWKNPYRNVQKKIPKSLKTRDFFSFKNDCICHPRQCLFVSCFFQKQKTAKMPNAMDMGHVPKIQTSWKFKKVSRQSVWHAQTSQTETIYLIYYTTPGVG